MSTRRRLLTAMLAVGLALTGCSGPAQGYMDAYLRAVAGGEADRGWHYLAESTREAAYAGDKAAYLADAAAADWEAFRWSPSTLVMSDDGFSVVRVTLLSSPSTVPAFLITRGLLNGVCEGDLFKPVGLGLLVSDRFLGEAQVGGGGLTGSQIRCNRQFAGSRSDAFAGLAP